jgi:hypothetical protein
MLWWLVGLWLLSPALLLIFWLLRMLASSSRSELSPPTGPAVQSRFLHSRRRQSALRRSRPSPIPDRPHPAPTNAGSR